MIFDNIRALCMERGVSVRRVERETGIANGVIRKWNHQSPRVDKLLLVADYFGVTLDELVRGTGNRKGDEIT
ncbi:MAG: helix-turn-helix transcriptional regulator [Oscillibacter sp.]|nr:helix-turn-helix transcriptional regulator [Oscillibacter sp.]